MRTDSIALARYSGATIAERLAYLERQIVTCQRCPLSKVRTLAVPGEGSVRRDGVLFIGEAPGMDEDAIGLPFVGRAGQLLMEVLAEFEIERKDVFLANALKCRPNPPLGVSNRAPAKIELVECLSYLYAQIEILDPGIIITLGSTALESLGVNESISEVRGTYRTFKNWPVLPTWHPAYVLRSTTEKAREQFRADLAEAFGFWVDGNP